MNRSGARASSSARRFVIASAWACALSSAAGTVARAAAPAPGSAEALYEEGRKAASDKNWALACTKFHASQAVEAAPGTLLNLGDCEENIGQLVQADADFTAAAKAFRAGDSRVEYAKKRAKALDARLAHLSLHFVAGTPADATVERDGASVDAATLGTNVAVDPGAHTVIVRAGGRTDVRSDITLAEGQSTVLALAAGVAVPSAAAATVPAAPAASPVAAPLSTSPTSPAQSGAEPPVASRPLFAAGVVTTVVGGAGVAFGLIAGAITLSKKSAVDSECPTTCTSQKGLDDESSGKTWSTISTVGVIAGAAVGAAGLTMVLLNLQPSTPNSGTASRFTIGPPSGAGGGGQLGWSGSF